MDMLLYIYVKVDLTLFFFVFFEGGSAFNVVDVAIVVAFLF